jgi:NADPH:quinone reductase-like Zn-dependent oxidoreductase
MAHLYETGKDNQMKAIVLTKYGSPRVLHLREVEKPTPRSGEVLVRVHAAAVNAADWRIMRGRPFVLRLKMGFPRPNIQILGGDIAGRVEAVDRSVKDFQPGDEVFGYSSSEDGLGGFAEYVSVQEDALALKPANLSFEGAAAVPLAALTALQGLRHGQIQPGQKVLIYGASGGVGSYAVQIAKSYGADVTAVCSTGNLDQARSLGADHVIDYKKEDFTRNGQRYDLILGVNGYNRLSAYKRALGPEGRFVFVGGKIRQILELEFWGSKMSEDGNQKFGHMGAAQVNKKDLLFLKELLEAGKIRPVIERRYPLSGVPKAVGYVEKGHARGKVVITVVDQDESS